ncbi:TetR/AcrR family transcriptional regulator [Bradyrhizobium prioriisuperbiae]|uniref:TetR/AcrR family transcriptional regulator n=1 Tax=Bradyrhizobium prioriisuperbiae TaxID=2854389 RepID=UPI0028EEB829|nr:TetR/AcrR family transcriptional regulator [Bradyrhizobium prioritasuperba]
MTAQTTARARHYAGVSAEERQLARRERLIEAAISVYGKLGYRNATVKAVCEAAGLTERYFYESFTNSEALLVTAFDTVSHRVIDRLDTIRREHPGPAEARGRAVLQAYYQLLKDEPDGARLFVIEIARVGPAVDEVWAALLREFGELLSRTVAPDTNVELKSGQMLRAGAVGAMVQIAKAWIKGGYTQSVEAVAEDALRLCRVLES